jgi:colanic acid biosynthesis glycosyl transferase WcaI
MNRLVAINRFYAPDHSATAQLLTDLAEHLIRHDQPVIVITSRLNYDDPAATLTYRETLNGVSIRRVWTTRFGRAGLWGRTLDYVSFYLSAFIVLLAETQPGDTILAKTDPPLISVPAAVAAKIRGARLVNWCQDVFPEIAASLGMRWAAGPIGGLLRMLRNWSLNQADCNVVLCDAMRDHLAAEGIPDHKLRTIHNWPDPGIRPIPCNREPREQFTICYSGNLGRAHIPEKVAELIRATAGLPLRWLVIGGGAGHQRLKAKVREHGIANVTFEGYAPRAELSASLARGDAHLVTLSPRCESVVHPSKVYGIMAAGRPAIFLGDRNGSVARMLDKAQAGITLVIDDAESWSSSLDSLIADPARANRMGCNARVTYERHYACSQAFVAWATILTLMPVPIEEKDLRKVVRHPLS